MDFTLKSTNLFYHISTSSVFTNPKYECLRMRKVTPQDLGYTFEF